MHYLVTFWQGRAGCLTLVVFLMSNVTVSVLWHFLMVPCVDVQCVIAVVLDHTHYRFGRNVPYMDIFNKCSKSFSPLHILVTGANNRFSKHIFS